MAQATAHLFTVVLKKFRGIKVRTCYSKHLNENIERKECKRFFFFKNYTSFHITKITINLKSPKLIENEDQKIKSLLKTLLNTFCIKFNIESSLTLYTLMQHIQYTHNTHVHIQPRTHTHTHIRAHANTK